MRPIFYGVVGFLMATAISAICSVGPITQNDLASKEWQQNLIQLFNSVQDSNFRVDMDTPTLRNIREHEVMFVNRINTNTMNLYTRNNNILWHIAMSSN